jgi:hypothetical protein
MVHESVSYVSGVLLLDDSVGLFNSTASQIFLAASSDLVSPFPPGEIVVCSSELEAKKIKHINNYYGITVNG